MHDSLFRALADPTRRRILELLAEGDRTAGDIAEQFPIAFASVSHHLGVLKAAGLVAAVLAAAVSVWAYPRLPVMVATPWNLQGTPDGYSSRFWAVAVMPLGILGLTALFNVLPKVDPKRENYARFLDSYWLIANAVLVFTGVAHTLILVNGLGYTVQVDRLVPLRLGLLFAFLGNYLTRVERS